MKEPLKFSPARSPSRRVGRLLAVDSRRENVAWVSLRAHADRLQLSYKFRRAGGEWQAIEQPVPIEWRACRFGGRRPYFRCLGVVNGRSCQRAVTYLYGARQILSLPLLLSLDPRQPARGSVGSCFRRANKSIKLGGEPGTASIFTGREKGMRHRTYDRLRANVIEAETLAEERLEMLAAQLLLKDRSRTAPTKVSVWASLLGCSRGQSTDRLLPGSGL